MYKVHMPRTGSLVTSHLLRPRTTSTSLMHLHLIVSTPVDLGLLLSPDRSRNKQNNHQPRPAVFYAASRGRAQREQGNA